MKKIVLIGNFGVGNLGDELLMLGGLIRADMEFGDAKMYVVTADKSLTLKSLQVNSDLTGLDVENIYCISRLPAGFRSIFNSFWIRTCFHFMTADKIIFSGGGLFDTVEPFSFLVWGVYGLLAKIFRRNIIFWGQSFSKSDESWIRNLTKALLKGSVIEVRDKDSKAYLQELGIVSDVKLTDDLSKYFINHVNFYKISQERDTEIFNLLISVRGGTFWEDETYQDQFVQSLVIRFAEHKNNINIYLMPFQIGAGKQDDLHICKILAEKLSGQFQDIFVTSNDIKEIITLYKKSDLVIACRLHSLILAKYLDRKFEVLSYHSKVDGFETT